MNANQIVHPKIGDIYEKLTVIGPPENGNRAWYYPVECICGYTFQIRRDRYKVTTACASCAKTKHSADYNRLRKVWKEMKRRCDSSVSHKFHRYGGRGIKVCAEWNDFNSFNQWAISSGYQEGLTIDRINNDGNYEPSNCRWISSEENNIARSRKILDVRTGRVFINRAEASKALGITTSYLSMLCSGTYQSPYFDLKYTV